MTIRFYKPNIVAIDMPENIKDEYLEREYKDVDSIQIIEELQLVVMYIKGQREMVNHNGYRMEIVEDIVDNDEKQAYCTSLWLNDLYQMFLGREDKPMACSKCKYVESSLKKLKEEMLYNMDLNFNSYIVIIDRAFVI